MNPLVSICIPTYEMGDKGYEYLNYSLNIIFEQTYKNIEIIISDHSKNYIIKNLCESWMHKLNIKYYHNKLNLGSSSANLNNSLRFATGEIIKVLFQDDFLFGHNSIELQVAHFIGNYNQWLVTACAHTLNGYDIYKPFFPKYHDSIQYGENTISSPSVLMLKNDNVIKFDENLLWLMDVDYYKMMYDSYGLPSICNYITIINREHEFSTTNSIVTDNIKRNELEYITKKYN